MIITINKEKNSFIKLSIGIMLILFTLLMASNYLLAQDNKIDNAFYSYKNYDKLLFNNDYGYILKNYVDNSGLVNYKSLQKEQSRLDFFLYKLKRTNPESYKNWVEEDKIAFWINAYNAFIIKIVLDNYPIEKQKSKKYPANSIMQINGVWSKYKIELMGQKYTLDDIENKVLNKDFKEPKIHFALVCGSKGSPPLRREAFKGRELHNQLSDQADRFLNCTSNFQIDLINSIVYISPIFKWYGKSFIKKYGGGKEFNNFNKEQRAVLNFHYKYLNSRSKGYLRSKVFKLSYLKFNWSLNEQEY